MTVFGSVFSGLLSHGCSVVSGCCLRITEGNSFGARGWGVFVGCCLLVRGECGLTMGVGFAASAYPSRLLFAGSGCGLAVC